MNIIECSEMARIKKHELIPTIIDHVFSICKGDKNFTITEDNNHVDNKLSLVESKLSKQKILSEKSETIKKDLLTKIQNIDNESFNLKYKILESLGSEL